MLICYFSSKTGNTKRFAEKFEIPTFKIEPKSFISEPFVLFCPTYADGNGNHPVPTPVIKFLNEESNRSKLVGVVGFGNRNFGRMFAVGSEVISRKCAVPLLDKVELFGTSDDVDRVRESLINVFR